MGRESREPGSEGLGLHKTVGAKRDVCVPHLELDAIMTSGMGGLERNVSGALPVANQPEGERPVGDGGQGLPRRRWGTGRPNGEGRTSPRSGGAQRPVGGLKPPPQAERPPEWILPPTGRIR